MDVTEKQIEALDFKEMAATLISAVDHIHSGLESGEGVFESQWLDPLMMVHGDLLAAEDLVAVPREVAERCRGWAQRCETDPALHLDWREQAKADAATLTRLLGRE